MTVQIANTELTNNFNSWRLATNLMATTISNNVVTVLKEGRGGLSKGDGHVEGVFSATTLAADTLRGGNTASFGSLSIASNTSIDATTLTINANTTVHGNVIIHTSGSEIFDQGDISRVRITGGNPGDYYRKTVGNKVDFQPLTLRQVKDLSSNSAHLVLSGSNTTFSDNGDSTHLIFGSSFDRAHVYLAKDPIGGRSDLQVNLVDAAGQSKFVIADSGNTIVGTISSIGDMDLEGSVTTGGHVLPDSGNSYDLGSSGSKWRDLFVDGTATVDGLSVGTAASQGVSSSLIPITDAAGNLGSTTRKWGTVWADTTNGGSGVFSSVGISGNLVANGNVTLGSDDTDTITVKGKFANLAVTGVSSFNGTTNFNGTMNINGNVNVGDQAADTLTVTSTAALNGDITLGDASTDTITVKGNFANQHTTGTATFGDVVGIATPTVTAGYVAEIDGKVYVHDDLLAANNVIIHGDLQIDGSFNLPSNATVSSELGSFTNLTVTNDATIGNDATDLISITGATTVSGNVDLNGAIDVRDEIKNDGVIVVSKNGKVHANNAITNGTIRDVHLENSGVTAGSYGGASAVPVITVNSKGLIDTISTTVVAGVSATTYSQANNNYRITTATGQTFDATISAAKANTTTTGTTDRGVASFDSGDFSVSSGLVSLKNASTGAVLAINGTAKEVNVSRSNGTVTVGLPDDVTVTSDLTVGGGLFVSGNLVISGTTTTVNTETLNLADNIIILNSNETGSPTQNAGIEIERGTLTNYSFLWDEATDRWTAGDRPIHSTGGFIGNASSATKLQTARSIGISLSGDVTGSGSASFDGTGNITISATNMTVQPNSVALGTDTTGNYVATTAGGSGITVTGSGVENAAVTITNSDRGSSQNIFKNIEVTDTDSGNVWTTTGTCVADINNDTLTFVDGGGIDIDASAGTDAIRIQHTDTSSVSDMASNNSGATVLQDISLSFDTYGHVTGATVGTKDISWYIEDTAGTEKTMGPGSELKINEGAGIDIAWGSGTGTDASPYLLNISHEDTSSVSNLSVDGSGSSALQDISFTFDTFGHVTGATASSANFIRADADDTASGLIIFSNTTDATSTTAAAVELSGGLAVAKSVYIGGTLYETSDERTKSNIQKIDNAVDKVMNLSGYTFDKEGSQTRQTGVIAQEVAKVLPEAIGGDENEMTVAYGNMVGLLIEAIKEQQKEIEELKSKLI